MTPLLVIPGRTCGAHPDPIPTTSQDRVSRVVSYPASSAAMASGLPSSGSGMTRRYPLLVLAISTVMAGLVPAIPIAWSAELLFIGITALDTLSRHGRACPGHPDPDRRAASCHRDPRDEPGDDGRGSGRANDNVLTLFLTLCFICAIPLFIPARRGRAREASQEWGGERSCSRPRKSAGRRPLAALCWSKSA
jgi:hypothetical protein